MKKITFIVAILALLIIVAKPQLTQAQEVKDLKEHVCTAACKDGCKFAHGEKGHVCTDECKKINNQTTSKVELKDHVCTDACKDGCKFAHGEKGHICNDDCKKK